jgi:hypothetical protein
MAVAWVRSPTWVFAPTLDGSSLKKSKHVMVIFIPLLLLLWEALGIGRKTMRLVLASIWSRVKIVSSALSL